MKAIKGHQRPKIHKHQISIVLLTLSDVESTGSTIPDVLYQKCLKRLKSKLDFTLMLNTFSQMDLFPKKII